MHIEKFQQIKSLRISLHGPNYDVIDGRGLFFNNFIDSIFFSACTIEQRETTRTGNAGSSIDSLEKLPHEKCHAYLNPGPH